ncbi:molybdate ABC transporter permease [Agaricicola taiwanensis]|uniref:Molybdenum transport system permease n=1 Tax=Agaricicola taiwanensis TaxID=591372 RepID=A0A8J3E063_9RHOB|nr:molybdate ABC transporter permease subunit [Agaricicola taiwanensis]GGE53487.1 molybdate ABC transporter permease [Agaricicola taiwanensis]
MFSFSSDEIDAILLSLRVATVATLFSLPVALITALILARGRFPGRILLDGFVHLPLVLPPVVTGYLLLITFGRRGPAGAFLEQTFGLVFSFRWTGAALAAAVMGFPLMVRAMRLSIEAVDPRLEKAARTLGRGPIETFLRVTVPLSFPGILAGAVLAFAKALGEFGATITFVSNIPGETRTLPTAIYSFTQVPGGDASAARLVVVAVAISLTALILSEVLSRRMTRRMPRLGSDVGRAQFP